LAVLVLIYESDTSRLLKSKFALPWRKRETSCTKRASLWPAICT